MAYRPGLHYLGQCYLALICHCKLPRVRALEPKKFTAGEGDGQDSRSGKIFNFVFGQQRRQ